MRIAIFGTGGVGGYFGGRLASAGSEVVFVARGAHLEALRREGLQVESVAGDITIAPAEATDDPGSIGDVDYVLLAVKTWQVVDAARAILPALGPTATVITLQNGIEAPYEVAEVVGRDRVLPGVSKIFSYVSGPGRIRHIGGPGSIAFAEWDDRPSERVEGLREELRRAGIAVEVPEDILATLWAKFLFVVPMGGVGAVSRAPVGITRSLPGTKRLLEEGMREIERVARARGVRLPDDIVARSMAFVDEQPAAGTSSLQRDIVAGRPSELEAWNGAVVRAGLETGIPTPVHRFIHDALLPQERRVRGELEFAI